MKNLYLFGVRKLAFAFKSGSKLPHSIGAALALTLTLALTPTFASVDPPHYNPNGTNDIDGDGDIDAAFYCNDCHKYRMGSSSSVTDSDTIITDLPELCMQCHNPAGRAKEKFFARIDQSQIGTKGTTHRFDSEGLQYVKLWKPMDSTGKVRIYFDSSGNKSVYTGNFDTENEMEYEFEIVAQGDVGVATFKYRCRTRSKPQPTNSTHPLNTPVWDRDADWSGWTSAYTTGASIPLNDSICSGDVGISLSFENGLGSPNSFDAGTSGKVYVKLLNSPSDDNMKLRVTNNKINCSVCHNQHSMQLDRPYLRAGNVGNALCKHCHDDRDRSHYILEMGTADDDANNDGDPDPNEAQLTTSLTDVSKNWTVDQWKGKWVYFQKNFKGVSDVSAIEIPFDESNPTGYGGFYRKITSNDSNTLEWDDTTMYLNGALNAKVENTLRYRIVDINNYSSHPVGIKYSEMDFETRFNSDIKPLPLDDNGTPSDTSDDTVQCMTCHSPHFTHSIDTEGGAATEATIGSGTPSLYYYLKDTNMNRTPGTVTGYELRIRNEYRAGGVSNPNWRRKRAIDSFEDTNNDNIADKVVFTEPLAYPIEAGDVYEIVNLNNDIDGDGYLLRKLNGYKDGYINKDFTNIDDDKVICKTCHKYKNHFGDETVGGYARSCMDCHTPHNTTNRFLLKEVINNREVRIRPGDNYVNSSRTGVCQVCHTQTKHWRNDVDNGTGDTSAHYAEGCPQCHQHDSEERSWIYICKTCHGYPPVPRGTIVDKKGNIHTSTTVGSLDSSGSNPCTDSTGDNPCTQYNNFNDNVLRSSYRVEDYEGGGGAHLVHVVGKGQEFECKVCHGHIGYGFEHGGSVGRKMTNRISQEDIRSRVTFNFQLDYSFNERLETKLGYHEIEPPVYPKFYNREAGFSGVYMNRLPLDATGGYGPGPIDIGGYNPYDYTPPIDTISGAVPIPADKHECYVGCHNPRRLYMQTEPESDMLDTAENSVVYGSDRKRYRSILGHTSGAINRPVTGENWATYWEAVGTTTEDENWESGKNYVASDRKDPIDIDPGYGNKFIWTYTGSPYQEQITGPRDENPDVPCAKCHDAQGTIMQGNEDNPPIYKDVKYISSHPADVGIRTDCLGCHDYYNATKPHKKGTPYLNEKDGGASIEFDITNPASLEPFCLSCHDSNGATDGNTATGNPKRPFSKETESSNEVPDVKVRWTGSAHSANISCFGDGVSNGCHGNPMGSAKRALLAPYNDSVGEEQKYFCFNCHGNNRDRLTLAPNIQDQIQKKDVSGGSGHPIPAAGEPWYHKRKESIIVSNRHSECIDCHDPMGDRSTHRLHSRRYVDIDGNPWNPNKDVVDSTHPMWGGDSTTNYVRQPYVYEVCLRCHGPNYATFFKDYMPFPQVAKDRVGMDGHFSDKRKEFDPRSNQFADYPASGNLGANTAYHPVAVPGRNATDPLYRQLQEALDLTSVDDLKTQTIQCPDCHNNNYLGQSSTGLRGPVTYSNRRTYDGVRVFSTDKAPAVINTPNTFSNTDNRQDDKRIGPHGSTNERILRAPYNTNVYYTRQARGDYGALGTGTAATQWFTLCFLCHKESILLETNGGAAGTNFGGTGNGWWTANLHAEHLSAPTYTGSEGGKAVCHECHHNVHSNVEAQNTIYGDGLGGMLPPDDHDGILDGVSSTHLLNFAPSVQGATALKPRWYYDGEYYRCDMYCHGANMNYCWYKHGPSGSQQAGSISQWCEDD